MRHLAEFGVVFLMFVIGLEFNLPKLRAMRNHGVRPGPVAGGADDRDRHRRQPGAGALLRPGSGTMGWQTALALSGALAMSSTAIVVKLMSERLELESRARQARAWACCCSRTWPWCRCWC